MNSCGQVELEDLEELTTFKVFAKDLDQSKIKKVDKNEPEEEMSEPVAEQQTFPLA